MIVPIEEDSFLGEFDLILRMFSALVLLTVFLTMYILWFK